MLTKLLACSIIGLLASAQAAPLSPAKAKFVEDWQTKQLVLRKPLYSIAYGSGNAVGVNMLSEDKGRFYEIKLVTGGGPFKISDPIADGTPDRLLQRVKAHLGAETEARLLEYKVGERLSVKRIDFEDATWASYPAKPPADDHRSFIVVRLSDQFAQKDGETTKIIVVWPEPWSESFTERVRVEKLLSTLFAGR